MPSKTKTTRQEAHIDLKNSIAQNTTDIATNSTDVAKNSTAISNIGQIILSGTAANTSSALVYIPVSGHTPCDNAVNLTNCVRLTRSGTFKTLILTKSTGAGSQTITVTVDLCTSGDPGGPWVTKRTWATEAYESNYYLFSKPVTTDATPPQAITFAAGDFVRVSITASDDSPGTPSIIQATLLQWVNLSS